MRVINVAAAQMGPIQKADSREAVVKRMIALMDEAKAKGADLIVYPELALTTFFPRWYMEDQAEVDTGSSARCRTRRRSRCSNAPRSTRSHEFRLCRADAGRASLQHRDPHRQVRQDRRQISQGSSARPFRVRHQARVPASGEALFRARRSRLQGLARARRHFRHGGLQRPALAGDLSRDGPAGRRDGADRLQHAVGQFARRARRGREAAVPQPALGAGRRLPELDLGRRGREGRRRGWPSR